MLNNLTLVPEASYGLVLYTDGGSTPGTSITGWGLHGYIYNMETKRTKFKKDRISYGQYGYVNGTKVVKEYKPGSRIVKAGGLYKLTVNDPKSMEDSSPVDPEYFLDFFSPYPNETVSTAEIRAFEEALSVIESRTEVKQAVIVADSQYVCKSITEYIHNWIKNNWIRSNGKPVEYADRWLVIYNRVNAILASGVTLRFGWTAAHVGEPGNTAADFNATKGKIAVINSGSGDSLITPASEYYQRKKLNNRLLEQRWWYSRIHRPANSYKDYPGKSIYFFGNHGKAGEEDDLIGKYTSSAKIAILVSNASEPVLDMLHDYLHDRFYDEVGYVTQGYLENITNTERYALLANEGSTVLLPNDDKGTVSTPDAVPVIREVRPTYHGLRLVDNLEWHLGLLRKYLDADPCITVTDITHLLYTSEVKGKKTIWKTTDAINPPNRSVSISVGYQCMDNAGVKKIPFKMGQDIPLRNTLNAIADQEPKVYAITWQRSATEFRYGTVLHAGEDVLLTCSLASNLVPLVGSKK